MCLIVDANVASLVFPRVANGHMPQFVPLLRWLLKKDGRMVYGGKNGRELFIVRTAASAILELRRIGKAEEIPGVDEEQASLEKAMRLRSDDPHVIALTRKSGARTLCSRDTDLHADFKDLEIVPSPKGMVYQNETHARTLRHTRGCRGPA